QRARDPQPRQAPRPGAPVVIPLAADPVARAQEPHPPDLGHGRRVADARGRIEVYFDTMMCTPNTTTAAKASVAAAASALKAAAGPPARARRGGPPPGAPPVHT